ncbi:MAG: efflux transporter outer membrane subunit [Gammaproteobacteria bacterium]|nr:efflux transporter outer membrane subunit [Gammaproteobacteria bacterium]
MRKLILHCRRAPLICISAILLLAGCAGVSPPPLPVGGAPAAWRNAGSMAAPGPAPDFKHWWRVFGDAKIDLLVKRAIENNLDLRQAIARFRAARALTGRSQAELLPSLSVRTYSLPDPSGTTSYFQSGFDAEWELGLFGRRDGTLRMADADVGIAAASVQAAQVSVVAEVVRSYMELRAAQERETLLARLVEVETRHLALIRSRFRLNLASEAEVGQAEARLAQAEAALAEPHAAAARSAQQIALLLGENHPDAGLLAVVPRPTLGTLRIGVVPAEMLRTRPDIRKIEQEVLKAAAELGVARADLYPRLVLAGGLTFSTRLGGNSLGTTHGVISAGPIIDIPLFDWGMRRAVVNARDAALSATLLAYRQAVLEGVAEVETVLAALEHLREQVESMDKAVASLERSARATQVLARNGLADGFPCVAADKALLDARLERAQAEEARSLAFIALYKALGGAPPLGVQDD